MCSPSSPRPTGPAASPLRSETESVNAVAIGALAGRTVVWNPCAWVRDACEIDGGALIYQDRMANLDCPANQVLRNFNVSSCGGARTR